MKIKHYRAADMRQALRQVREAQGPDAVILSSRRIANGVEVVAAVVLQDQSCDCGRVGCRRGSPIKWVESTVAR